MIVSPPSCSHRLLPLHCPCVGEHGCGICVSWMPSQQTSLLSVRGSWCVVVTLLPTMHPVFSLPPPLLPSLSSTRRLWSLGPGRSRWKIDPCGALATLPTTLAPPCTLVSMSPRLRSYVGFSASLWSSASAVPCRTMALGLLPKLLLLIFLPAWLTALPSRYSTANKIFAFLAGNGWAGLNAERPLPVTAGHFWYSHLLSRWRHL